jgi:hypothetical protein
MTAKEILAGVGVLLEELPPAELEEFVGELARAQAIASLRVLRAPLSRPSDPAPRLLTVEDVAAMFRISEANVYARAKTDLRVAAVDVGPGQLRFDAGKLERFIEARRRS